MGSLAAVTPHIKRLASSLVLTLLTASAARRPEAAAASPDVKAPGPFLQDFPPGLDPFGRAAGP
ncbi:hypothetical protein E0493_02430 [Roseomonas sp. M0104]|uniref:Uncharacterized protein n=1 Tax=Teichococcus coralli TaxID=2545983 RepID=A0A845BFF1_9PROT|nr:hypothetical protein [Pseudoroseomonas coralli]MXP62209.1 hypothetical protein [Pseudoroseomonas coralli]